MTTIELQRIQFLDKLYDAVKPHQGHFPLESWLPVSRLMPDSLGGPFAWSQVIHHLAEVGLIQLHEPDPPEYVIDLMAEDEPSIAPTEMHVRLTVAGRIDVESRRQRRQQPDLRRRAAREAVLHWLRNNPDEADFAKILTNTSGWYEGAPFDAVDLEEASAYLYGKGLIDGSRVNESAAVVRASITDLGNDCIDNYGGAVTDYLRSRAQPTSATNVQFHGPVSGNVTWASDTVSQTATTTGASGADLAAILATIKNVLPQLGLPPKEAEQLGRHLEAIEAELAEEEPEKAVVTTFTKRISNAIGKAAEGTLATTLNVGLKLAAEKAGIEL